MTERVEFGGKDVADTYREEYPEHICSEDDARLKTVAFTSDTPDWLLEQARLDATDGRGERAESTGQVGLTEHEKDDIDFSKDRANVPHARAVKGIAAGEGVDDWLAHYDPTLTVDEHRDVMESAALEGGGKRLDSDDSAAEKAGRAARTAQSEQCDHAEGHCEHGDEEACEFLRDACGFEDSEVEALLDIDGEDELPRRIQGALSQLWNRYQIGIANAKEAAASINEIHDQQGRDLETFDELGERQLTKADIDWTT